MRANIPTPVVIGILVVVVIGVVVLFVKAAGPRSAGNEDLIRAAFSGKGKAPRIPPPPAGTAMPGMRGPGGAPVPPPPTR